MQTIKLAGTPLEIGFKHGQEAVVEIRRGVKFYEMLFKETAKLSWEEVCQIAAKFLPYLRGNWPDYCEEINGISQGSRLPFLSILAMNVRTEIAYGMFTDGCTALCWALKDGNTFLAQNWDWRNEQAENLIHLIIEQPEKPTIDMITEAGIIGKIGQNSSGIGVCLNAIRARGVDFNKLPCHLALRTCLESRSAPAAIEELQKSGVASACHILVADADVGGTGLECSHLDIKSVMPSDRGVVTHTNHFLKEHADVNEVCDLPDTIARLRRINYLVGGCKDNPSMDDIANMLKDEDNYPTSINRAPTKDSTVETLFSIVMNLTKKESRVKFGRPS